MARKRYRGGVCPNCGARYADAPERASFCPGCGQENHDLNVPLRHLIAEVAEGLFHFDSKSIRTLVALVSRPGLLSAEFAHGRRARYVTPVRLYVFVSFVFFLVLALPGRRPAPEHDAHALSDAPNASVFGLSIKELRTVKEADLDALMTTRRIPNTWLNKRLLRQAIRAANGEGAELEHLFLRSTSAMMFVLMPVFAWLLFLLFRRSAPHYVASLVFSLHYHSVAFLLLAALTVLSRLPHLAASPLVAPPILLVYLAVAIRTAYGRSWRTAAFSSLVVGLLHLTLVLVFVWAVGTVAMLFF